MLYMLGFLGYVLSSWLVCLVCSGVLLNPFKWWSFQPPLGVCINVGDLWNLDNPISPLWQAFLARPCCYLLLGEMLFFRMSQWPRKTLGCFLIVQERLCSSTTSLYYHLRSCLVGSRQLHSLAWFSLPLPYGFLPVVGPSEWVRIPVRILFLFSLTIQCFCSNIFSESE